MNMSPVLMFSVFILLYVISSFEAKKFQCPLPTGIGVCIEGCGYNGRTCQGRQLCCSNGCGQTCQDPVKAGYCPYVDPRIMCPTLVGGCTSDFQCPGNLKCCARPCSTNACLRPTSTYIKPGTCPPVMIGAQTCINPEYTTRGFECSSDSQCPGDEKCCPRTCLPKGCVEPLSTTTPSSSTYPPAPYSSTPYPPAPYSSTPYPPAPYSSTPYPPAPYSSTPYPPAPYSSTPYLPAPYSSTPYPPAPYSSIPYPPAPYSSTPYPPAPYSSTPYPPAPYSSTPYPPIP